MGRCQLINVTIDNRGIDRERTMAYCKREVVRHESCEIIIGEGGEFFAQDIVFEGEWRIEVKPYTRMSASMVDGELYLEEECILQPSWTYEYCFSEDNSIQIKDSKRVVCCL